MAHWHTAEQQEDKELTDSLYSKRLQSLAKMWNYIASWKKKYGQKRSHGMKVSVTPQLEKFSAFFTGWV